MIIISLFSFYILVVNDEIERKGGRMKMDLSNPWD